MNWIDFSKEKPKAEPNRQILLRDEGGWYGASWSTSEINAVYTHWAEIEPPTKPDHLLEAKRIASAYYDKLGRGKADPDLVAVIAQALLDQQMISHSTPAITGAYQAIQPPPTPDPFEEWWKELSANSGFIGREAGRHLWDAALRWKEGK